ncbi:MAG TPA: RodZ domain-containing protein, partial [archaeon]|nr:RodZ domain-containing protein [archaeon]
GGGKGFNRMPDTASTAEPDKVSIGQMLRRQREERGLTPEQAAYQCKVPLRLLEALEADDYRMLPDPAYLTRLLHEYAVLLRLDPAELETEFRSAIRRPPGTSLAMIPSGKIPSKPAPAQIAWKEILWTAAAILIVTPLVFIALSLASKRAADRPAPPQVAERPSDAQAPAERPSPAGPEQLPPMRLESVHSGPTGSPGGERATPQKGRESAGTVRETPASSPSPFPGERKPQRFLLTARAVETTWMAVRSDDGQERQVLLQQGQIARFVADARFVVTVGNAGGVELSLNGKRMPPLGGAGQVIRDLVIPSATGDSQAPAALSPGAAER